MNLFEETHVTYPSGALKAMATIVVPEISHGSKKYIVTDTTPFHPEDHTWPDQPADTGWIQAEGQRTEISNALVGAFHQGMPDDICFGEEIPVRRGEPAWTFFVAHEIGDQKVKFEKNSQVLLSVDESKRAHISRQHSAAHFMSLAMNKCLVDFWNKDPKKHDCFGHANFDALAIQSSQISESSSIDTYRLGKSLRKKGFNAAGFISSRNEIEDCINTVLTTWLSEKPKCCVSPGESKLTAKRIWSAKLSNGMAEIQCGGTHAIDDPINRIKVAMKLEAETKLIVTTHAS